MTVNQFMQVINVPDEDGRTVVAATTESIKKMVEDRYRERTKKELPPNWKLKIIMTDKSTLTVLDKEIKS
jgi:hypothetical protein